MALIFPLLGGPRGQVSEKDGDKVDGLDEGKLYTLLTTRRLD